MYYKLKYVVSYHKYEYLTGEDLGFKPSTIEKTKFEYSPLLKFLIS